MKTLLLTLICVIGMITIGKTQCTTAPYGQYPTTTYEPVLNDQWTAITTAGYSGEYSVVSVVSGQRYHFLSFRSSNGASRFLTITDNSGTPILSKTTTSAYADSAVWVATYTGTIRFYTHTTSGCGTSTQTSARHIRAVSPPPVNDNPAGAILLTVNDAAGYKTYSNVGSTNTLTESTPTCASYNGGDVWFKVVVPAGISVLEFDTQTGGITDGGMSIYRGTPGSLTEVECDDDDALDGLMPYIYRDDATPGETIYIRFWEYGGNTFGTFNIFVSSPQALPVELVSFEGTPYPQWNVISWVTVSENNSDYFSLESSVDGISWREIGRRDAAGNSTDEVRYSWIDYNQKELTYYRLIQYDIDGKHETYGPIAVSKTINKTIVKYVNLMGQEVNPLTTIGLVIEVYSDGSTSKVIR
jgi:hypothetical protein